MSLFDIDLRTRCCIRFDVLQAFYETVSAGWVDICLSTPQWRRSFLYMCIWMFKTNQTWWLASNIACTCGDTMPKQGIICHCQSNENWLSNIVWTKSELMMAKLINNRWKPNSCRVFHLWFVNFTFIQHFTIFCSRREGSDCQMCQMQVGVSMCPCVHVFPCLHVSMCWFLCVTEGWCHPTR